MSEPSSGQIISSHLLKLVLGVVFLTALAMLACSGSDGGSESTPTAPPGMFSTLPTSEPPVLGDQPPTVELNTPEPTLTPQPTPTPNPTYTPNPRPRHCLRATTGHAQSDRHTRADGHAQSDRHSRADGHAQSDRHSRADGHAQSDRHSRADGHAQSDRHC